MNTCTDDACNITPYEIRKFWKFVQTHNADTALMNGRLYMVLYGSNLDAFAKEYENEDVINAKIMNGAVYVEAKWLCDASQEEIMQAKEVYIHG